MVNANLRWQVHETKILKTEASMNDLEVTQEMKIACKIDDQNRAAKAHQRELTHVVDEVLAARIGDTVIVIAGKTKIFETVVTIDP